MTTMMMTTTTPPAAATATNNLNHNDNDNNNKNNNDDDNNNNNNNHNNNNNNTSSSSSRNNENMSNYRIPGSGYGRQVFVLCMSHFLKARDRGFRSAKPGSHFYGVKLVSLTKKSMRMLDLSGSLNDVRIVLMHLVSTVWIVQLLLSTHDPCLLSFWKVCSCQVSWFGSLAVLKPDDFVTSGGLQPFTNQRRFWPTGLLNQRDLPLHFTQRNDDAYTCLTRFISRGRMLMTC